MEGRAIKTRVWNKDDKFGELSKNGKYLFIYLITCPHINQIGKFELPDRVMCFETSLTPKDLQQAKEDLTKHGMAFFEEGWIYVSNASKHNNYKGEKNLIKQDQEQMAVPSRLFKKLDRGMDRGIGTPTIGTNTQYPILNNKYDVLKDKKIIEELRVKFPGVDVDTEVDKMMDWLASTGKTKKDYVAFARNWLRKARVETTGSGVTKIK